MRGIEERYKPDIALCTVGIAPGTSPRSGAEVTKLVQPRVAIPYHTDRPKDHTVHIVRKQDGVMTIT